MQNFFIFFSFAISACHFGGLFGSLSLGVSFFSSLSLSPSLSLSFSRSLSHRIIIRQIRLSAASLHDMPSLACGASPVFTPPLPRLYRCPPNPSCKIQRPARSASLHPQHPRFSSRPTSLALFPQHPRLLFRLCQPLTSNPSPLSFFGCLHRLHRCVDPLLAFKGGYLRCFFSYAGMCAVFNVIISYIGERAGRG